MCKKGKKRKYISKVKMILSLFVNIYLTVFRVRAYFAWTRAPLKFSLLSASEPKNHWAWAQRSWKNWAGARAQPIFLRKALLCLFLKVKQDCKKSAKIARQISWIIKRYFWKYFKKRSLFVANVEVLLYAE